VLLTHGAQKKKRADAEWERPDNTPVNEGHTHEDVANVCLGVARGDEMHSDEGPTSLQKCAYGKLWPW